MQSFDQWLNERLRAYGCYNAVVDDAHGRATIEGLKAFQAKIGLPITGTANEATVHELRKSAIQVDGKAINFQPVPIKPVEPVWMREARRLIGTREVLGPKSNPVIISWAKKLGGWIAGFYKDDVTPWCGLFMGNIIATTLPHEQLPANPLGALEWAKFGRALKTPALGAILVFERSGGGHVTLYAGENDTHYRCLGGNQSDNVTDTDWIPKSRRVATRWPMTGEAPIGGPVMLAGSGPTAKEA
jgi:uncharacterized protein (TIGR02594 family)